MLYHNLSLAAGPSLEGRKVVTILMAPGFGGGPSDFHRGKVHSNNLLWGPGSPIATALSCIFVRAQPSTACSGKRGIAKKSAIGN